MRQIRGGIQIHHCGKEKKGCKNVDDDVNHVVSSYIGVMEKALRAKERKARERYGRGLLRVNQTEYSGVFVVLCPG